MSDLASIKNRLSSLKAKLSNNTTNKTTTTTTTTTKPPKESKKKEVIVPASTTNTTAAAVVDNTVLKKKNEKKNKAKKPNKKADKKKNVTTSTDAGVVVAPESSNKTTEESTVVVEKSSTTKKKTQKKEKQGVKRKQQETSEEPKEETKETKKKNKNKKSKKAIKAAIKTFVLKLVNDNIYITEEKVKECFPEQTAIVRMGPRLILIQFPTEEIALGYLKTPEGEVKNLHAEINGEKFKITKHAVKEIFNPRWYNVKPRVTEGASLGLEKGQKVNAKFTPYLEIHLKEKLGNDTNTTISDMEKGETVFFEDAKVEEKFKSMIENGEFKVPSEYINEKKSKKQTKEPANKKVKRH